MRKEVQFPYPCEYSYQESATGNKKSLLLLLHGYQQTGVWIYKRLRKLFPDYEIYSPNALFPLPHRLENSWLMTYGWYFFDPDTKEYIVDMQPAVDYLKAFLEPHLAGVEDIRIIGFSQGGYIAPVLAKELSQVKQVIGVGCRYRTELLTGQLGFRIDAIHGVEDQIVEHDRAQECHAQIISQGNTGEFLSMPSVGHELNPAVAEQVRAMMIG